MSTVSVQLPESIFKKLGELAQGEGISVGQLVTSAVIEKTAALMTLDYIKKRGERGNWEAFDAALAAVPDVEPDDFDKL